MSVNPFTDQARVRGDLYTDATRLDRRSHALHAAKTSGENAAATIARLARTAAPRADIAVDIGGGSGAVARHLAGPLAPARIVVLDRSPALLAAARRRLAGTANAQAGICGDFHHLPLPTGGVDLVVAAFCLYHTTRPQAAVAEIARCLAPTGAAVIATKSVDSYREIDQLVTTSGLDPHAARHPSLYETFASHNATDVVASALRIEHRCDQRHTFRFEDFDHLAAYLTTSPKYQLPAGLRDEPTHLAQALRSRVPERPLITTSTVTYVVGTRP